MCKYGCDHIICGKEVFYGNDNLRRYLISNGESYESIIEKAFLYIDKLKDQDMKLEAKILALEARVKILEDAL
jgi:hypothetical protein